MSPKIRKKDPCPCGSGKKYKDCCFRKERPSKDDPSQVHNQPRGEKLEELLEGQDVLEKLGGILRDLQTEGGFQKCLEDMWDSKKVAKMSTQKIVEKLELLNVHFDEEQFREQAQDYISAIELAEDHYYTQDFTAEGYDEDFIWLAIIELWKRLISDKANLEMIDDAILDGHDDLGYGDYTNGLKEWEAAWNMIKTVFPPEITAIEKTDEYINSFPVFKLTYSLSNWCQDFEVKLYNGGLEDKSWVTGRITYAQEFCERFPDTDRAVLQNMLRAEAESYAIVGDIEKAENLFELLTKRFPDEANLYIAWGDIYWKINVIPLDYEKAEKIYRSGLDHCPAERDRIYERLKKLEKEKGEI